MSCPLTLFYYDQIRSDSIFPFYLVMIRSDSVLSSPGLLYKSYLVTSDIVIQYYYFYNFYMVSEHSFMGVLYHARLLIS